MTVSAADVHPRPEEILRCRRGQLVDQLDSLDLATSEFSQLSTTQITERVAAALTYLHDEVLPHAHAEEVALIPMDRPGHQATRLLSAIQVEHDTLRDATAHLGHLGKHALTPATMAELRGLLAGVHLMLVGHFTREANAYGPMLERLDAEQRRRLVVHLTRLGEGPPDDDAWPPNASMRLRPR